MTSGSARLEHFLYDGLYWLLFALAFAGVVFGAFWPHAIIFWISIFCFFIGLWSGFAEPNLITTVRHRIPLVHAPRVWIRVAFLSDLHAGLHKRRPYYARVAEKTLALRPDVVLIGGDLVEETAAAIRELAPLARLQAPLGKFFILGNHDYLDDPDKAGRQMRAWGYRSLMNGRIVIRKQGQTLEIIGLEDSWFGKPDFRLLAREERMPRLLLLHEPDNLLDVEAGDAEAIVMGHTHGGQVRLPLIGALRRLPQKVSQRYDRGLRSWKDIPTVISQGVGESESRVRLFCPPEIVMLELGV